MRVAALFEHPTGWSNGWLQPGGQTRGWRVLTPRGPGVAVLFDTSPVSFEGVETVQRLREAGPRRPPLAPGATGGALADGLTG
jgi:hypothetical protein